MAATVENKISPWVKKVVKIYRRQIFGAMVESLEEIRAASIRYIIPNTAGYRMKVWQMRKKQPNNSTKLTSRTGRLIKMLKSKATWSLSDSVYKANDKMYQGTKSAKMNSRFFRGSAKVKARTSKIFEEYTATLYSDVTDDSGYNKKEIFGVADTKETLDIRFKHDKPGIRGTRRMFITPAIQAQQFRTSQILARRAIELRKAVI